MRPGPCKFSSLPTDHAEAHPEEAARQDSKWSLPGAPHGTGLPRGCPCFVRGALPGCQEPPNRRAVLSPPPPAPSRPPQCDQVMEFSWSALWNITDETPDNCEMFLNFNGMRLFLDCLKVASLPRSHPALWGSHRRPAGATHRPTSPGFAANRRSRGLP